MLISCEITAARPIRLLTSLTYLLTDLLLTYLIHGTDRVLLQKLTGFQLVKKSPHVMQPEIFIITFTRARHLSLS